MNKMYVGNLPFTATESDLSNLFAEFGEITQILLMADRDTGRSRGFAFVTLDSAVAMEAAIRGLDGHSLEGRSLVVNEARARSDQHGDSAPRKLAAGGRRW